MAALEVAKRLVQQLADREKMVVFAESCTGGLISAEMAKVPGVSNWLCGSAVTYRSETKVSWLDVVEDDIARHSAVSSQVASQMAMGVLQKTPEASVSASITGHLGPDAPDGFDGIVFVGIAMRNGPRQGTIDVTRHQLRQKDREKRQAEAAELVLRILFEGIR